MPTLTSVTLVTSVNKIFVDTPEIDPGEHLRADADARVSPCKVIVGKQYRRHGKSNDARNANTALVYISHLIASTRVGKSIQCTQAEDQ